MKMKLGALLVALTGVLALGACSEICEVVEDTALEGDTEDTTSGTDSDEDKTTYYSITFDGNDFVYAIDLPEKAAEGDEISFTLLVESGYQASNVSVTYKGTEWVEVEDEDDPLDGDGIDYYDEGDDDPDPEDEEKEPVYKEVECDIEVELEGNPTAGYTFTMPDKDVTVHAEGLGAYFNLWYDSDEIAYVGYNNDSRKLSTYWGNVYEPVTGTGISTGANNYIQAGREVMIVMGRTYTEDLYAVYANGVSLEKITDPEVNAGYQAFALTMPAENTQVHIECVDKFVSVSLDTSDLVDEDGKEMIDAYLYTDEDSTPVQRVEGQKIASDKPYVYAKLKDDYAEDWTIDTINLTWNRWTSVTSATTSENSKETDWSSTSTSTDTSGTAAAVDSNTKKFQIPSAYFSDDEIVVTFTLKDMTTYKDYDFVGTWSGYEFYNGSKSSSVSFTIDGSGYWKSSTSYVNDKQIVSVEDGSLNCTLADGRIFYNDGKVGALLWSNTTTRTSDAWIVVKDVPSGATVDWDIYKESNYIFVIRLSINGKCVGAIYADGGSSSSDPQIFYAGVTIEFSGSTTTVAEGNFIVKDSSGNTLKTVTA